MSSADRPRIGLALGAGGTKGTAHVGILKVLDEEGIPIDFIAGASIGAAYGAAYAAGCPVERMVEDVRRTAPQDVVAFVARRLKLDSTTFIGRRLYEELNGLTFAGLKTPFWIVASDLLERRPIILREGDLLTAVQAAISVPLMAAPVRWGNHWLMDGGFWESAPASLVASMGAERIIQVVLGGSINLPRPLRPPARRIIDALDPLARRSAPGLLSSAGFLLSTLTRPPQNLQKADVSIIPDTIRISANSPFHVRLCMERGEEAARGALPQIRALLE